MTGVQTCALPISGHDTWEGDSWKDRSGANAWPFYFTVDEQRGLAYLPLASPLTAYWGGDRKGANLYGNSVVAVDILTGKYRWHFQTIHHDLWDHDPPAPPVLFDVTRNGRTIPALAVSTKSGYVYILNRETIQEKAGVLAHAVVAHRDIKTADGEFDIFQHITAADVQRVARTYFTPENRLVLTLMPGKPSGQGAPGASGGEGRPR